MLWHRAAVAAAFVGVWLLGPGARPAAAQTTFDNYGQCLRVEFVGFYDLPGDTVGGLLDPDRALAAVWECSADVAVTSVVPIGRALLGSLVLIMIVWRGAQMMFGGRLDMPAVLNTVLLAGFAFMLMDNYFSPTPRLMPWGVSRGAVALVAGQGVQWSQLIIGDSDQSVVRAYNAATIANAQRGADDYATLSGSLPAVGSALVRDGVAAAVAIYSAAARQALLVFLREASTWILWAIGWIVYAQYLWGYFTLSVVTMVGPLFIPLVVIDPLREYFWGWFKALLQSVLYMLTAAALYALLAMVLVVPFQRIAQMPFPTDSSSVLGVLELMGRLLFEFVPLVALAAMGAFKVSALTSMVFAGGTPVASGIGSGLAQAEAAMDAGARRVRGWRAARAAGADGGKQPLSSTTEASRGPRQALWEVRQRLGAGARPGPLSRSSRARKPKGG